MPRRSGATPCLHPGRRRAQPPVRARGVRRADASRDLRLTLVSPGPLRHLLGHGAGGARRPVRAARGADRPARLATRAAATFVAARAVAHRRRARAARAERRIASAYDLLSFDIGSHAGARRRRSTRRARSSPLKPDRAGDRATRAALPPAAAGGRRSSWSAPAPAAPRSPSPWRRGCAASRDASVTRLRPPLARSPDAAPRTAALVERALRRARHPLRRRRRGRRRRAPPACASRDGRELAADLVVWATGAVAPPLFAARACRSTRAAFCASATICAAPAHPRDLCRRRLRDAAHASGSPQGGRLRRPPGAGAGAQPARRARGARAATPFHPQPRFLSLLNTGDGRAILSYGALSRGTAARRGG